MPNFFFLFIILIGKLHNKTCPPLTRNSNVTIDLRTSVEIIEDLLKEHSSWYKEMEKSFKACKCQAQLFYQANLPYEKTQDKYSSLKNDLKFIEKTLSQSIESIQTHNKGLTKKVAAKVRALVAQKQELITTAKLELQKLRRYQAIKSMNHK